MRSLFEAFSGDISPRPAGGELGPDDILGDVLGARARVEPTVGTGNDPGNIAHDIECFRQTIGDDFRVLDEASRAVDYPRDKDDVVGWRVLPECRPEGVLRALIEATVRAAMEPKGEASYAMRLVFQAYALRRPLLDDVISHEMDGFARHFIEALGRAVPGVTPEEIGWRYYFVIGATLFTSFDSHRSSRLRRLRDGLCDTSNADRMIEQLLAFFMQGIRGQVSNENLGANRVLRISAKAARHKSKVKG